MADKKAQEQWEAAANAWEVVGESVKAAVAGGGRWTAAAATGLATAARAMATASASAEDQSVVKVWLFAGAAWEDLAEELQKTEARAKDGAEELQKANVCAKGVELPKLFSRAASDIKSPSTMVPISFLLSGGIIFAGLCRICTMDPEPLLASLTNQEKKVLDLGNCL
eukprot:gnl/MRDRNA2_/MRDRNA2_84494_c0_seq4.p1 gnl/MRDRNA2_/MRDRNA2_84494_c0~~gnl/MRDRNA2_/MRDRNA2_84494_c0_seq4.p1  ORF type:complete len:168 (+),score=45.41 gnl/MRDRNA2_/MRDRNA2_84494_c0_seq4:193-696(+)